MQYLSYRLVRTLLIFGAVYAFVYGQLLLRLRRRQVQKEVTCYSGTDEIAAEHREILDLPRAWLQSRGFRHVAWQTETDMLVSSTEDAGPKPKSLYLDQSGTVRCRVGVSSTPRNGVNYKLAFFTELENGEEICTINREGVVPAPAHYRIDDGFHDTDDKHLDMHLQRIAGRECVAHGDFERLLARTNQLNDDIFRHWQEKNLIAKSGAGWQVSWPGAFQLMKLVMAFQRRIKKAPKPVPVATSARAAQTAEKAMLRTQLALAQETGSKRKSTVFLITAALSALSFAIFFHSYSYALALLVVVLFHEMGHYTAMRLFGYQDLSIFFIPLFGGAASGRKNDARPWQQLIMLLAGPVPGILLALFCGTLLMLHPQWLQGLPPTLASWINMLLVTMLVINYLNLLPAGPLDGGRVVELLFFSRFPRASFAFTVVSMAVLALVGLWFVSLLLLLTLRFQWHVMQASRLLRPWYGTCQSEDEALTRVADVFSQGRAQHWALPTRINMARLLLPRLQGGLPGWKTVTLGGLAYISLWLLPVVLIVAAIMSGIGSGKNGDRALGYLAGMITGSDRQIVQLKAGLARAKTADERIDLHLRLRREYERLMKPDQAQQELKAAYDTIDDSDRASEKASEARTRYAASLLLPGKPLDAALAIYAEDQAALVKYHPEQKSRLAQAEESEAQVLATDNNSLPLRLTLTQQALALRQGLADTAMVIADRLMLAEIFQLQGKTSDAIQALQANQQLLATLKPDDAAMSNADANAAQLTWLLIAGQQVQQAAAVTVYGGRDTLHDDGGGDNGVFSDATQAHGYALLAAGDSNGAASLFGDYLQRFDAEADKDEGGLLLEAPYRLDLINALRQAHRDGEAAAQEAKLTALLDASPGIAEALADELKGGAAATGNVAAPRQQAQLAILKRLGYPKPHQDDADQ